MKRLSILTLAALLLLALAAPGLQAQEAEEAAAAKSSPVSLDFGAKLKSKHVWNGKISYDSWNLQPDFTFSAYGFYFNAWGCMPVTQAYGSEVDLTLGYEIGPVSFGVTDFYYTASVDEARLFTQPFFTWDAKDNGRIHQTYVTLGFSGVEKFPIFINVGTLVFGDYDAVKFDKWKKGQEGGEIKSNWSTYIELGYSHTLSTGQTLTYRLGGTPHKGFFFDRGAGITNIQFSITQPFKITDSYTIPVTGDIHLNPAYEQLYFVLAVQLF